MEGLVILSSPDTADFVECSNQHVKAKGKLYKKMIFRWGEFSHPNNPNYKVKVDRDFYDKLKTNFDNRVCPIVQFPLVDDQNRHVESPDKNLGEIVDMSADEEGIYTYIDVRKFADDVGSTILGASAKVSLNYDDRKSNTKVGPTLIHVAATNRPYLTDLKDFETVSASADTSEEVVLLLSEGNTQPNSEEESSMNKDELIAALTEYGIDVAAGQQALADVEGFVALSNVIEDDVVTPDALANTIVELTNSVNEREERIQELTAQIQEVNLSKATSEVEGLIEKGRILPAWKEDMIDLSMNDRDRFETFLLPEKVGEAELSEQGFTPSNSSLEEDPADRAKAEGARLAGLSK